MQATSVPLWQPPRPAFAQPCAGRWASLPAASRPCGSACARGTPWACLGWLAGSCAPPPPAQAIKHYTTKAEEGGPARWAVLFQEINKELSAFYSSYK